MAKIKFDGSNWKVKLTERSRGRMKLNIKLSKDESEGFKNWSAIVKPDQLSDDDFLKQIFFNGIEHLNSKLEKISQDILNNSELRQELETSGFNLSSLDKSLSKP